MVRIMTVISGGNVTLSPSKVPLLPPINDPGSVCCNTCNLFLAISCVNLYSHYRKNNYTR